jgi:hypothetical protein
VFEVTIKASEVDAWALLGLLRPCKPRFVFYRAIIDKITTLWGDITMLIITDSQQVDLAIKPLTKKGHPAQVDGVPVWLSSDPLVATVEAAADGLSAVVKAAENIGPAQISVSADVDLGEGVNTMTGTLDIEVVGGGAAAISIIAGAPVEQP